MFHFRMNRANFGNPLTFHSAIIRSNFLFQQFKGSFICHYITQLYKEIQAVVPLYTQKQKQNKKTINYDGVKKSHSLRTKLLWSLGECCLLRRISTKRLDGMVPSV